MSIPNFRWCRLPFTAGVVSLVLTGCTSSDKAPNELVVGEYDSTAPFYYDPKPVQLVQPVETVVVMQPAPAPLPPPPPVVMAPPPPPPPAPPPVKVAKINPEAERILKSACDTLAAAKVYSFKVEVWDDKIVDDVKVAATKTMDVDVRRPNGVQAEVHSAKGDRVLYYDGKTLTAFDRGRNVYSSVAAPGTINRMLDVAREKFDVSMPLDEFVMDDPCENALHGVRSGEYFGKATVLGVPCQHIGFSTDAADWQLWVAEGAKTVRKIVLTHKTHAAEPQYTAIFSDWNLNASVKDSEFTFTPPTDAKKVEILPSRPDTD